MRLAVVHVLEHHVFEGDEVARRLVEIAVACRNQLAQRILAVDRHEPVAQRVVRRMQRHRERHRTFFAQPVDARNHAGGRHGDPPPGKTIGVVVEHHAQRRDHVVQVEERLAHSHHDDVGHRSLALQQPIGEPELPDDLGCGQVAVEALLAGRAERAVEHAARLARYTKRAAARLGNEHGLHRVRAVHLKQPLARAVRSGRVAHDGRRLHARHGDEPVAQRPREVAHFSEVALAALVHPLQDLAHAKRLLALRLEEALEPVAIQAEQVRHREYTSERGKK